jgi:hypothetical protein
MIAEPVASLYDSDDQSGTGETQTRSENSLRGRSMGKPLSVRWTLPKRWFGWHYEQMHVEYAIDVVSDGSLPPTSVPLCPLVPNRFP